jgi:hypothetical protein
MLRSTKSRINKAVVCCLNEVKKSAIEQAKKGKFSSNCEPRLYIALLSLVLLWATSLTAIEFAVYTVIISPTLDQVVNSIYNSAQIVLNEKTSYDQCAKRHYKGCNESFNLDLNHEVNQVNKMLQQNDMIIQKSNGRVSVCSDKFNEVIISLDYLEKTLNLQFQEFLLANATNETCANVDNIFHTQSSAIAVQNAEDQHNAISNNEISELISFLEARSEYDKQYAASVIGNLSLASLNLRQRLAFFRPQVLFPNITANLSMMLALLDPNPSLRKLITDGEEELRNDITFALNQTNDIRKRFFDKFSPIYNFLKTFAHWLNDDSIIGKLAKWFDVNSLLNFDSFKFPSPIKFMIPQLPIEPSDGAILAMKNAITSIGKAIEEQNLLANITFNNVDLAFGGVWLPKLFQDYDPPRVDIDILEKTISDELDAFKKVLRDKLGVLSKTVQISLNHLRGLNSTSESQQIIRSLLKTVVSPVLSLFVYPTLNFGGLLAGWHSVSSVVVILDVSYRIYKTFHIFHKQWQRAITAAPLTNLSQPQSFGTKRLTDFMTFLKRLPAIEIIILVSFMLIISAAILMIGYLPIYYDYVDGCVHGTPNGRGTMLTANANNLAQVFASFEGDAISQIAVQDINSQRQHECDRNSDLVFNHQQQNHQQLTDIIQNMNVLWGKVNSFRQCLNTTSLDLVMSYPGLAFVATNRTSLSVQSSLFNNSCHSVTDMQFSSLIEPVFSCNKIRTCVIQCHGPSQKVISDTIFNSGCQSEMFVHASVIGTLMSFVGYIGLNIASWFVLMGVRRLVWKKLTSNNNDYRAVKVNFIDGKLYFQDSTTKKKYCVPHDQGSDLDDQIKHLVKKTMDHGDKIYRRNGITMIVISCGVALIWVVLLFTAGTKVKFQYEHNH